MIQLLKYESNFIKGKRFVVPFISLLLIIGLMALLTFITSEVNDPNQLAEKAVSKILNSSLIALFYLVWLLQHYVHLYRSGYYKMLLAFGFNRHRLFVYQLIQTLVYTFIFLSVMWFATCISGIFMGIMPWLVISSTSFTSVISYFLYLMVLGQIAALLASTRKNHMLILPVLFYWFFESWVNYLITKQNADLFHFLPLDCLKQIIGNEILTITQSLIICGYTALLFHLLYFKLQKRNLS
nr:hypothetical protein [uncultured Carboxylicivirga sp.]